MPKSIEDEVLDSVKKGKEIKQNIFEGKGKDKKKTNKKASTEIQAILFNKKYYTIDKVNKWIEKHNYKPIKKIDTTDQYHRVRLKQPNKNYKYRTDAITKTIKYIYMIKK